MAEIPASELQQEGQQDIFKLMDHRAPYDFGADALLSDGAYYPNAVQDYDGNWYDAVIIGNRVWMAQNLRTTHFADGTAITEGVTLSSSVPYYKNLYSVGQSTPFDRVKYGLHYNWAAVMNGATATNANPSGVQGIAPTGWHVPSKAEVDEMIAYLNTQKRYFTGDADENNGHLAKALAATYGWQTQSVSKAPGCNPDDNNVIGFNLPPAGLGLGYNFASSNTMFAYVYTCTERVSGNAHILTISNDVSGSGVFVAASSCDSTWFAPVRCLCDFSPAEFRRWYVTQYKSMQHLIQEKGVEVFVCTYNNSNSTVDKTPAEIYAAYQDNMEIVCFENNVLHRLSSASLNDGTYYIKFDSIVNPTNIAPSLAYVVYNGTNWVSGQYDLQKRLYDNGANQNIKTINGNLILGSGNITIPTPDINTRSNPHTVNNNGTSVFGLNGYREYSRIQYADGVTTHTISFTVSVERKNYDRFIVLDNRINTKDVTITINDVQIADNNNAYTSCDNIFKPSSFVIKAGSYVELTVKILKSDIGSSTGLVTLNDNVSGQNIKTINGQSLLGSGNIEIDDVVYCTATNYDSETHEIELSLSVAQIQSFVTAGKAVVVNYGNSLYYLNWKGSSYLSFVNFFGLNFNNIYYNSVDSKWYSVTSEIPKLSQVDKVFVCTYNSSNNTMNKTYQQIVDARNDGKVVICRFNNLTYYLSTVSETSNLIYFIQITDLSASYASLRYIKYYNNAWSHGNTGVQLELIGSGTGQNLKTVLGSNLLGSGNIDNVGVCISAEYADELTASVDGFTLRNGAVVHIRFANGIKTNENSTYPKTLNINNTGAKTLDVWGNSNVFYYGSNGVWLVGNNETATIAYFAGNNSIPEGYYLFATTKDLSRLQSIRSSMLTSSSLKTVNGNDLVGTGNIELGKGILTGVASSLSGTTAQATLNQSGADLENGAFLMISFSVDMPAGGRINVANTVINNSDILWNGSTLPAGAINAGDTCMLYYNYAGGTNLTFLLFNSGWGATLMDNDTV